ncbi:tetratricopeptide repeat protein [Chryseobacterium sp. 3008163]|uniref:tetratricopeptide repeat protein n=1 Tax=Chryseobacterium sp. 3008163 TaxID=2478663 RepID=UPI000F0C9B4D|nr:hypothetical protein [Chryseobacterium sp. 3008163]AYN02324.1 hypothetical protein EAG08_20255 [Chryseobacterium sp. 3008163]
MRRLLLKFIFFSILTSSFSLKAQQSAHIEKLRQKISTNSKLFTSNIDKAYQQLEPLLIESRSLKDSLSEMKLLDRKCRYFYSKNLMDSLIVSSENLQQKSREFKDAYYEAMANVYLAETYSINNFHDKAIIYLNNAYEILQKDQSKSKKIFYAKANILNSYSNIYLDINQPRKAAKKILEEIATGKELKNPKEYSDFQYLNYSNLANIYIQYNIDSADYYVKKSMELTPIELPYDKAMVSNHIVLGEVMKYRGDYKNSISNFHKALFFSQKNGIELNKSNIYTALQEIYNKTGKIDSAEYYQQKLKQLDLNILQSKYNSLQKVIEKEKIEDNQKDSQKIVFWIIAFAVLIGTFGFIIFKYKRKSKKAEDLNLQETYKHLINLVKNKDESFLFAFENIFPLFSNKLLKINPDLQQSEIEFCALLKIKLTTKEIAQYTFIETRTVQNKKYRLRKKLEIPANDDIYQFIDNI